MTVKRLQTLMKKPIQNDVHDMSPAVTPSKSVMQAFRSNPPKVFLGKVF